MSMKKSDLDKNLGLKIGGKMKAAAVPGRFGQAAHEAIDKREQRRRDSAAGLAPFACKLPAELIRRLHDKAVSHPGGLNGMLVEVIERGLASE